MKILDMCVTPNYHRADAISSSVVNVNFLLLITPLEMSSFSSYVKFSFLIFSACLRLSTSTIRFPFLVFLAFFGLALIFINFSLKKMGEFSQVDLLQRFNDNESE